MPSAPEQNANLAATMKLVSINILVFVALFALAEAAARFVYCEAWLRCEGGLYMRSYPGQYENSMVRWMKHDPDVGWVLDGANRLLSTKRRRYKFEYSVNNEGFRNTLDFISLSPRTTKTRVMLLGDSFVFGLYLQESDTLSSVLESKLGEDYEVFNLGISGWGIDQMLLAYKKYTDVIRPDIVILAYIDNDIRRAMEAYRRYEGANKPSFEIEDDSLVRREPSDPPVLEKLTHKSLILNKFYYTLRIQPEMIRLTKAIFSELVTMTTERGQELIILRYPLMHYFKENNRPTHFDLSDFFENQPIEYLDPHESILALPRGAYKRFYLEFDRHPSKEGNEFMADYIIENTFLSKQPRK